MNSASTKGYKVLSIDAWRDTDGGWFWNNWYKINMTYDGPLKTRAILKWFRESDILRDESKGCCSVEDDGFNLVIIDRKTRQPMYALEAASAHVS